MAQEVKLILLTQSELLDGYLIAPGLMVRMIADPPLPVAELVKKSKRLNPPKRNPKRVAGAKRAWALRKEAREYGAEEKTGAKG